jgi:hypothetical protein
MKVKTMTYWTSTAILTAGLFTGGLSQLGHQQDTTAAIQHLGYPLYFMTIIGTWKVLAVFALLVPGFARLKEWAYAGVFFQHDGRDDFASGVWRPGVAGSGGAELRGARSGVLGNAAGQPDAGHAVFSYGAPLTRAAVGHIQATLFGLVMIKQRAKGRDCE